MSLCQNSEPGMLNMEMNLLRRWVLVKNLLELVFFFLRGGGKVVKGGGSKRRHAWVTVTCRV